VCPQEGNDVWCLLIIIIIIIIIIGYVIGVPLIHSLFLQIGTSGLLLPPPPPNLSIYLTDCYFNTKQYNGAAPNHDQYPCTSNLPTLSFFVFCWIGLRIDYKLIYTRYWYVAWCCWWEIAGASTGCHIGGCICGFPCFWATKKHLSTHFT